MMKKTISILLVILLCVGVLCSCGLQQNIEHEPQKFGSAAEMKKFVDGIWACGNEYYIIENGTINIHSDSALEQLFNQLKETGVTRLRSLTFDTFYETIYLENTTSIKYGYESGQVVSRDSSEVYFTIYIDGTVENETGTLLTKTSVDTSFFYNDVKEKFESKIDELIFQAEYDNLPVAREVQYNKLNYLGQNFIISGTAELDDYYNWNYADLSAVYFCIRVTPSDGDFSDTWYIYADRYKYSELYQNLFEGPRNINIIATTYFYDTGSDNMATLVDYN